MAKNLKVAQPYANAFIQMTSGKKDSLDKVIADLTSIEAALESKDLVQALSNPLISVDGKKTMIKSVFQGKIDNSSLNFL